MEQRVTALEEGMKEIRVALKDQGGKIDKLLEAVHAGRLENEKRFGSIESRLTGIEVKLETKADKTDLASIETKLAGMETKLDFKAARTDLTPIETKLGVLEGRVSGLPTTWTMIGIIGAFIIGITSTGFGFAKLLERPAPSPTIAPSAQPLAAPPSRGPNP